MAFESIPQTWIAAGKFAVQSLFQRISDNFEFLNGALGTQTTGKLLNPSFEVESGGTPSNWTITPYTNGSQSLDTTSPTHGAKCLKFTHPGGSGNGGGVAESDYIEVDGLTMLALRFFHWASAAGMHNKVVVKYYDKAKAYLSPDTLYDSTANPTSVGEFRRWFLPPSNARFMKVELHGGMEDTDVAGSAYFDRVMLEYGAPGYFTPGTDIIAGSDANSTTGNDAWTKLKEIQVFRRGVVDVYYEFAQSGTDEGASFEVRVNGVAVGQRKGPTTNKSYTPWNEPIAVEVGDLVQVYGYCWSDSQPNVKNFRLRIDAGIEPAATQVNL